MMREHGVRAASVRTGVRVTLALTALGLAREGSAQQQSLAARVAAAPAAGTVAMHFPARPGVCGDGRYISLGSSTILGGAHFDARAEVRGPCEPGPVRVVLTLRDHQVEDVRTSVGGGAPTAEPLADLGAVDPSDGAAYLLGIARRERGRVAERALLPAVLADRAVVWPALLAIARDSTSGGRRRSPRSTAAFWLSRFAAAARDGRPGEIADREASGADEEGDVRGTALFALAQLPRREGIASLIEVARAHRDPWVRAKAIFWLGQSGDERAYVLFEELLSAAR